MMSEILARLKNPIFLAQVFVGAFATVLAYAGLTAADMTTWDKVMGVIRDAASNPYCLALVVCNIWSAISNPAKAAGAGKSAEK